MKPFDIERAKDGDKVVTRDGRDVEILKYDRIHPSQPIVALLDEGGWQHVSLFTHCGRYLSPSTDHCNDLMMATKKKSITKWFNIDKSGFAYSYFSENDAKQDALYFDCVIIAQPVPFEWEE